MKTIQEVRQELETRKTRSAWDRGVNAYALELKEELLNGAENWSQYSWGGSALIYDGDIAERLCTPSELKRTRNGERRPNAREEWLDTQARALYQAATRIIRVAQF